MIGVDTNVLVRIFASDDAPQAASAIRLIDESKPEQIFVNVVVLAEFAWTMRRAYKWEDDWIRHALNRIVRHPAIQHRASVLEAITDSNTSIHLFADRLIAALNLDAGCETTLTFDQEAAAAPGFRLLKTQQTSP
jgi:predicted nucleic-acid-binding protein